MMKLACVRCKNKKIKCDKAEGTCHQCVLVQSECVYVERKKRPRLAQQRKDVTTLTRRLEFLEKQLSNAENNSPVTSQSRREVSHGYSTQSHSIDSPVSSDPLLNSDEDGQAAWIYRLASDTKRNFEKVNTYSHPSPAGLADTPSSSNVDTAISTLGEALKDLAKLRIRDEATFHGLVLDIDPEKAKLCVKTFVKVINELLIPEVFVGCLDLSILDVMPDMVDSPYVNIDPCVKVMYYNALYYGLHRLDGPRSQQAQAAYYKCLEAVPAWLDTATGTTLDAHTAGLTAWTAINNFDYQLSWKFHCKACHYIKIKGVERLDLLPSKTHEEEEARHGLRYLYWYCMQTDLLFRVFYGKPSVLSYRPNEIKPPVLFRAGSMQPRAIQATLYVVWLRFNVLTREIVDKIDGRLPVDPGKDIDRLVEEYCHNLEQLVDDWDLDGLSRSPKFDPHEAFLYADLTMNIHAIIVGVKRLTRKSEHYEAVDTVTLRAARKVISIILHFHTTAPEDDVGSFFVHFMSFYPFCAIFSLYEHILACVEPDECEDDLRLLEALGAAMKQVCEIHPDMLPLSNTVTALNKVSQSTQDVRRNGSNFSPVSRMSMDASPSDKASTANRNTTVINTLCYQQHSQSVPGFNLPTSTIDGRNLQVPASLDPFGPGFPVLQDFPMNHGESFEPLGLVRALESDFMGKNWHEPWWDMNGDIEVGIDGNIEPHMAGDLGDGP